MIPIFLLVVTISLVINELYGIKFYMQNVYLVNVVIITTINIICLILFNYSTIKNNIHKEKDKLVILISLITLQSTYGLDRILEMFFGNYLFNKNYLFYVFYDFYNKIKSKS